jgi:hypothetical protein
MIFSIAARNCLLSQWPRVDKLSLAILVPEGRQGARPLGPWGRPKRKVYPQSRISTKRCLLSWRPARIPDRRLCECIILQFSIRLYDYIGSDRGRMLMANECWQVVESMWRFPEYGEKTIPGLCQQIVSRTSISTLISDRALTSITARIPRRKQKIWDRD